jgi:hypothetical protein
VTSRAAARPSALRLTARGAVAGPSESAAALREEFDANRCVRLAGLIEPRLLQKIQALLSDATFEPRAHGTISTELCMAQNDCLGLLHFLVNDPAVFQFVQGASGRAALAAFVGRVYRVTASAGHYDSWHSDVGQGRQVGLSVNLGTEPFRGGVFELRRCEMAAAQVSIANTVPGDAILFAIDDDLEHRITPVEGTIAKTAFAGWFTTGEKSS